MSRNVSSKKYLIALILTTLVFFGGVVLGFIIDDLRLDDAKQMTLKEKVNLRSLQLQQQFIDSGQADCKALNKVLEENIGRLQHKMETVLNYKRDSFFNNGEFKLQLQDYFLTEIQFLLTSEEIDQKCAKDSVKILYFYDENDKDTQGSILGYLKKKFDSKVLIFSFDSAFTNEPMIPILLTEHKITQFPSVVIENKTYHGHQNIKELMNAICTEFASMENIPQDCVKFNNLQNKINR